jgi:flotillin
MARIEEERKLEEIRVARNELREKANTVVPAAAASQAKSLSSEGEASRIRENGKATAEALAEIKAQWTDETTREIMLLQMLPQLLDKVTHVLHDNLHVERLTVVDSGTGGAVPNHVRGLTGSIAAFLEQLKTSTGVDVPAILRGSNGQDDDDGGGAQRSSARGPLGHKGH